MDLLCHNLQILDVLEVVVVPVEPVKEEILLQKQLLILKVEVG